MDTTKIYLDIPYRSKDEAVINAARRALAPVKREDVLAILILPYEPDNKQLAKYCGEITLPRNGLALG